MFCFQKEVNFLGEIVNDKGVMTTPEKNRDNDKCRTIRIFYRFHKLQQRPCKTFCGNYRNPNTN